MFRSSWMLAAFVVAGASIARGQEPQKGGDPAPTSGDAKPDETDSTLDEEGRFESIWDYLRAKYDANADGTVSAAEYTREGGNFERLDRNRDGALTDADFQSDRQSAPDPAMLSRALLAYYFQDDEDSDSFQAQELELAIVAFDSDYDGKIVHAEFEAAAEARRAKGKKPRLSERRMLDGVGAFEMLVGQIDRNEDEALGGDEIFTFFKEHDGDGDLVWSLARTSEAARNARPEGPPAGAMAPDFALGGYHADGAETEDPDAAAEKRVKLSSFRGKKPVALIFGSYT